MERLAPLPRHAYIPAPALPISSDYSSAFLPHVKKYHFLLGFVCKYID